MSGMRRSWIVVLAAGEGKRVRSHLRTADGKQAPKQFCTVWDGESLLRRTLGRASRLVPEDRIVIVVARQHRCWWESELADLPPENIIVQPENRGTAVGLLLPFVDILRRDPLADVLVLPSDHHVERESCFIEAMGEARHLARLDGSRAVLLGIRPSEADPGYGWILPGDPLRAGKGHEVAAFVEKPETGVAESIMRRGGLLNTLVLAAKAGALLRLYRHAVPWLIDAFSAVPGPHSGGGTELDEIYSCLPGCDFSKEVLERCCHLISVLPVAGCGWSDLGTPDRLERLQLARVDQVA